MARRDPVGIRLITRKGNDWTERYPLVAEAVNHLKVRSCLIDGEAVACDNNGVAVFRTHPAEWATFENLTGSRGHRERSNSHRGEAAPELGAGGVLPLRHCSI
jgi:ATP-dependent DNA ligase